MSKLMFGSKRKEALKKLTFNVCHTLSITDSIDFLYPNWGDTKTFSKTYLVRPAAAGWSGWCSHLVSKIIVKSHWNFGFPTSPHDVKKAMAPLCMLDDLWQAPPSCDISPFTFRAWPHSKAESSGTHQFTDLLREHSHFTSHILGYFWPTYLSILSRYFTT